MNTLWVKLFANQRLQHFVDGYQPTKIPIHIRVYERLGRSTLYWIPRCQRGWKVLDKRKCILAFGFQKNHYTQLIGSKIHNIRSINILYFQVCKRACFFQNVIETCGCFHPLFVDFDENKKGYQPCNQAQYCKIWNDRLSNKLIVNIFLDIFILNMM